MLASSVQTRSFNIRTYWLSINSCDGPVGCSAAISNAFAAVMAVAAAASACDEVATNVSVLPAPRLVATEDEVTGVDSGRGGLRH